MMRLNFWWIKTTYNEGNLLSAEGYPSLHTFQGRQLANYPKWLISVEKVNEKISAPLMKHAHHSCHLLSTSSWPSHKCTVRNSPWTCLRFVVYNYYKLRYVSPSHNNPLCGTRFVQSHKRIEPPYTREHTYYPMLAAWRRLVPTQVAAS